MAEGGVAAWGEDDPNLQPQNYAHTMYYNEPVIPIEGLERDAYYRAPTYLPTTQSLTAQQKEFCEQLPKFSGLNGEDVLTFIKRVDQTMQDLRLTSGQVASALFSKFSPLQGRASTFVNQARSDTADHSEYRHAIYWCAQERVPGRDWIPYQPRRPSVDSIPESVASVDSQDSVATQDSVDTAASVGVPEDGPNYIAHVQGVHGIENRRQDDRTKRVHRMPHQPAVHRRRHQYHREMIPDQPAVPPLPQVDANQCLRHYLYYEFHEKLDRQAIEKQFELTKTQKPRQSVREYIWTLKIAYEKYKLQRFGKLTPQQKLAMKDDDDYNLTDIIKSNAVKEFKTFMQQKLTTDPDCLKTVQQMENLARRFETMTDVGKNFTNSCKSDEKVQPVMALTSPNQDGRMSENMAQFQTGSYNYNPSYYSTNYMQPPTGSSPYVPQTQQPHVYSDQSQFAMGTSAPALPIPPMPDHLANQMTQEAWRAACSASQQQQHAQYKADIDATLARISALKPQPPTGTGRGGANRGRGGRGGGRGRGRGAASGNQSQQQQPPPPPNTLPPGCTENWSPSPAEEAQCIHANNGRPRCYFCGVCGHSYSTCGYRREDVKNGKKWNVHPKRGQLLPKKTNSNRYITYKRTQTAAAASIANFSDFVLSVTSDPNYRQQQKQQQTPQQDVAAENAALRAELTGLRSQITAIKQQHHEVSAAATAPPQQPQRSSTFKAKPQGGSLPKPTRPPIRTEEEIYNTMDQMTSPDYNHVMHQELLERQDLEHLRLLQNSQAKEAREELDRWCP